MPTKSGLMMGLGETNEEIVEVLKDLREHGVNMLTLGQYLQPSRHHLPVKRYVPPAEFDELKDVAMDLGFSHAACGPFVRSSYHADLQAKGKRSNKPLFLLAEKERPGRSFLSPSPRRQRLSLCDWRRSGVTWPLPSLECCAGCRLSPFA